MQPPLSPQPPTPTEAPLPPPATGPERVWSPKMTEVLRDGASFQIDPQSSIGGQESIGLDPNQYGEGFTVLAKVEDGVDKTNHTEENGIDLAVVKLTHPLGTEEFFLVGDKVDENGQVTKSFVKIHSGVEFTVGRKRQEEVPENQFIDGKALTGEDFSDGISRSHFTIKHDYVSGAVEVNGLGVNGTKVEALKQKSEATKAASAAIALSGAEVPDESAADTSKPPVLISSVPKTDEEVAAFYEERDRLAEEQRLERIQPQLTKLQEQIALAEEEFNLIKDGLTKDEASAVWKVAAARVNYEEARAEGNSHVASMENRNIGTFTNELPTQRARDTVSDYTAVFRRLHSLRSQHSRLLNP